MDIRSITDEVRHIASLASAAPTCAVPSSARAPLSSSSSPSARLKMEPRELARDLVAKAQANHGDTPTMAAYDMSKIPALVTRADALSRAVASSTGSARQFADIAAQTQYFKFQFDLGDFAERIVQSGIPDEQLKLAAAGVQQAISEAVIAEQHADWCQGAHGISVVLRGPGEGNLGGDYGNLKFARETHWQDVHSTIDSGSKAQSAP